MRVLYLAAVAALLAGCAASGAPPSPRASSTNYIEPPMMPAGPIAPGPNLGLQPSRMPHAPGVVQRPHRCPAGYHWVKKHRAPGPAGSSTKVPGGCRR